MHDLKPYGDGPVGFFEEAPKEFSMMRLISFLCTIIGLIIFIVASIASWKNNPGATGIYINACTVLGAGITGKIVQRIKE